MRNRILTLLLVLLLPACMATSPSAERPPAQLPAAPVAPSPTVPPATGMPASPASVTPDVAPRALSADSAAPTPLPTADVVQDPLVTEELAALQALQRIPRDQVTLAQALAGLQDASKVARTTPLDVQVGDVQDFWVTSTANDATYSVTAELRYAGPVVLMYVEQGLAVDQTALEQAAHTFEQQIYPRTRELFGSEWQPGVDGDPRITILNARSPGGGVAGYFSSRDAVPRSANRFSNEREMVFMNVESVDPASTSYLDVLAHEFQHMIHWNEQRNSAIWFNEGSSTLAEDLNGFVNHGFAMAYLADPDVQLTAWSEVPGESLAHYGAANLFMRYIYAHYAGEAGLAPLVRANAGNNLDAFVQLASTARPDISDFGDLFADWAIANLLDDPGLADGRYAYKGVFYSGTELLPATVIPERVDLGTLSASVHQFGVDYYQLPPGPLTLEFTGTTSVHLVGEQPHGEYAWWSGRGDNSVSTLTHALDLGDLDTATLRFDMWYELETNYDYAFVSVSTDEGRTWQTLAGNYTTDVDPHGSNYGNGFNGVSGAPDVKTSSGVRGSWVEEVMDLTPYTGRQVLLRFWQINDDAFNAPGLLVDNIEVCSADAVPRCVLEDDGEAGVGNWQAEGFARVDGDLPQLWELRLVRTDATGNVRVESLHVDSQGHTGAVLEANERAILMVAGTTPHTTEVATYQFATR